MNYLYKRRFILFLVLTFIFAGTCNAEFSVVSQKTSSGKVEKRLFGSTKRSKKKAGSNESGNVHKAKKKQEANQQKLKNEYAKSVEMSQKRTVDIQTPEVQARMKKDKKAAISRDRTKKKKVRVNTRSAAKKYS